MYLHIGNQETVRVRDLVAFFDFDSMTVASISRRFLQTLFTIRGSAMSCWTVIRPFRLA